MFERNVVNDREAVLTTKSLAVSVSASRSVVREHNNYNIVLVVVVEFLDL